MRKLLRHMAKVRMTKMGYNKVNKRMGYGNRWREVIGAYPVNIETGEIMRSTFYGKKKQKKGSKQPIFIY